jgi:hypothetical protein
MTFTDGADPTPYTGETDDDAGQDGINHPGLVKMILATDFHAAGGTAYWCG